MRRLHRPVRVGVVRLGETGDGLLAAAAAVPAGEGRESGRGVRDDGRGVENGRDRSADRIERRRDRVASKASNAIRVAGTAGAETHEMSWLCSLALVPACWSLIVEPHVTLEVSGMSMSSADARGATRSAIRARARVVVDRRDHMVRARSVPRARRCVDANRRGPPRVRERDRSGSERAPCSARDGAASPRKRERDVASRSFVRAFVRGPRDRRERSVEPVSTFRPSAVERTARRRIDRSIRSSVWSHTTGRAVRPERRVARHSEVRARRPPLGPTMQSLLSPSLMLRSARVALARGVGCVSLPRFRAAPTTPRARVAPPLTEPFSPVFIQTTDSAARACSRIARRAS